MALYSHAMAGKSTATTTDDIFTIVTTATGAGSVTYVKEFFIAGEATSSIALRLALARPTAVGVTPTAATLAKLDPASATNSFSVVTAWSTQPTVSGGTVLQPTLNAQGGQFKYTSYPEFPIVTGGQGAVANLSFRPVSGSSTISGHVHVEER